MFAADTNLKNDAFVHFISYFHFSQVDVCSFAETFVYVLLMFCIVI